jgi:hypothetical protein
MNKEFEQLKEAAHAFIDACEAFDEEALTDTPIVVEMIEDVHSWLIKVETELKG